MNKTSDNIADDIIKLADQLNTENDLWEAWKTLNKAMCYINAKHTMAQVKEER
tara:strand:- start:212 stop:370 length:159 start_codon:yes stop_codon:yes gene_type:complete